jgi:hypothetical protein
VTALLNVRGVEDEVTAAGILKTRMNKDKKDVGKLNVKEQGDLT